MMKTCILLPGKIKPRALSAAQQEYAGRLKAFGIETVEYKEEKISPRAAEQTRETEAARIGRYLKQGDYLIVCDERGDAVKTAEMAAILRAARNGEPPFNGRKRMVIVIGGALGLAESIRQKADAVWALSPLVLAGGIARLVLLEGLYRAFTILEGHPYHNE